MDMFDPIAFDKTAQKKSERIREAFKEMHRCMLAIDDAQDALRQLLQEEIKDADEMLSKADDKICEAGAPADSYLLLLEASMWAQRAVAEDQVARNAPKEREE